MGRLFKRRIIDTDNLQFRTLIDRMFKKNNQYYQTKPNIAELL